MNHRLGIDTGGTFTDFLSVRDGELVARKVASDPASPARPILDYLSNCRDALPELSIVHGSTVATNTLLERRGARTALVATRGFADVIEIGRQDRPHLYDLRRHRPPPLVARAMRFELDERIAAGGGVVKAPSAEAISALARSLDASGAEAIAVCLLFSPENDTHERQLAESLRLLDVPVAISSEIHPELREYERCSTTVINAYVAPVVAAYLHRLANGARPARLFVMESASGVQPWEWIASRPVSTVLSGPAGGVAAAARLSRERRLAGVASFDMGGTSTDVALVRAGEIPLTRACRIAELPIAIPTVDVHTVGAGGGSIGWIDQGSALRVGPESAGAEPGPICYGRGGKRPTVTDAHLLLGHIPADLLLGGFLPLVREGVAESFQALGAQVGLDALATARGMIRVVEAEMERALRRVTQERGADPREITLLSFGGAGGLHAVCLARALGVACVLVPPQPGLFSARGMLLAPFVENSVRTVQATLTPALLARLAVEAGEREERSRARLHGAIGRALPISITRELSLRFAGQSHELEVKWTDRDPREVFLESYAERYGEAETDCDIEVTVSRSRAYAHPQITIPRNAGRTDRSPAPRQTPVFIGTEGTPRPVPRLLRAGLVAGERTLGPAIIEEESTTVWLPIGSSAIVESDGCLSIEPGRQDLTDP